MNNHLDHLNDAERSAAMNAVAFLRGRLQSISTIDWALRLRLDDQVRRAALIHVLSFNEASKLKEPWRSAWRLIEEFWNSAPRTQDESVSAVMAKQRIIAGDRSGSLVSQIVGLVSPRLKIEPRHISEQPTEGRKRPRPEHLFRASLDSPRLVTFEDLGLEEVREVKFLTELAQSIDAAVDNALSIAKRVGWDGTTRLWRLGFLYRVDYVQRRSDGGGDIDDFHTGIAPAAKLLNSVLQRIAAEDPRIGSRFARRWIDAADPVHLRLWAALSRNSEVTTSEEVGERLIGLPPRVFWGLNDFPEVAELRAIRFSGLRLAAQKRLLRRLRRGPPASQWPKDTSATELEKYRSYWTARELRRIELAGAELPPSQKAWLRDALTESPDLRGMDSFDEGFPEGGVAQWIAPDPDRKYDSVEGIARLQELEAALGATRVSWQNDPSERASDWVREGRNCSKVLEDLSSSRPSFDKFPLVIEQFGWTHSRRLFQEEGHSNGEEEARSFISIVAELREDTVSAAIDGITHWLSDWSDEVNGSEQFDAIWAKVWPIAVAMTNAATVATDENVLSVIDPASDEDDRTTLDTLNTAAGRMVGLFLSRCPTISAGDKNPFLSPQLSTMRDDMVSAEGRAGLIARHRLVESLNYFLLTDEAWARQNLIATLEANDSSSIALWRAIARRTQFKLVLKHIGELMIERTTDPRLGRRTRSSLLASLVLEPLHAFLKERESVVSVGRVQQAIRTVEDELRARAADVVTRFLKEMGSKGDQAGTLEPESIFNKSVLPFIRNVWPQERSLATPGVSAAWADLPAAAGAAFSSAVEAIESFLVPFSCWSMSDFGLRFEKDSSRSLQIVDTPEKARALLRLLDATIGTAEGAVVPYDLSLALLRVGEISPELPLTASYKRLSAAARGR